MTDPIDPGPACDGCGRVARLIDEGVLIQGKYNFYIRKFYCSWCLRWGCTIGVDWRAASTSQWR